MMIYCQSEYLDGLAEFSEVDLAASKSSLIFSIIEEEETPSQASTQSLLSYLRGVSHEYNRSAMLMSRFVELHKLYCSMQTLWLSPLHCAVVICEINHGNGF